MVDLAVIAEQRPDRASSELHHIVEEGWPEHPPRIGELMRIGEIDQDRHAFILGMVAGKILHILDKLRAIG